MALRGNCWTDHLQTIAALECYYHAHQLAPNDPAHHDHWGMLILLHQLLLDIQEARKRTPNAAEFKISYPNHKPWEKQLYPFAVQQLNRILKNDDARQQRQALQQLLQQDATYV